MTRRRSQRAIAILLIALHSVGCADSDSLSQRDVQAVEATLAGYRRAWLDNDRAAVMEKISDEVVVFVPGLTTGTVQGKESLESFWFPPSDSQFVIRTYEITDQEIHGGGKYAIAQGKSSLAWDTVFRDSVLSSSSSNSEFLSVLRNEDGQWRIFRQMYVLRR